MTCASVYINITLYEQFTIQDLDIDDGCILATRVNTCTLKAFNQILDISCIADLQINQELYSN